ncbi:MAG: helix-turn-helix transcriptional regulator [Burkholderiales bacterium]|nr:helix-turn-helix transcriptional regulator [Burkholderiales bacterium]
MRDARKSVNLTLEKASDEVPCSKSYLWEMENGTSEPSLRVASGLALAYGLKLETLASYLPKVPNVKLRGSPASGRAPLERRVGRFFNITLRKSHLLV